VDREKIRKNWKNLRTHTHTPTNKLAPVQNGRESTNKMHTGSRLFSTIAQDRHGSDTACSVSAGLDLLTTEPDYKIAITALTPALSVQNEQA
jgi:hypothetical protein